MVEEIDVEPQTAPSPGANSAPSTPRSVFWDAEYEKRFELTPRSKLKKLLQDNSEEEEEEASAVKRSGTKNSPAPGAKDADDGLTAYERVKRQLLQRGLDKAKDLEKDDEDRDAHGSRQSTPKPTNSSPNNGDEDDDMPVSKATRRALQKKGKLPFDDESSDEEEEFAKSSQPDLTRSASNLAIEEENLLGSDDDNDDDDLPKNLMRNSRFQELVERKRRERLQKEEEERRKAKERRERQRLLEDKEPSGDEYSDEEDEIISTLEKNSARPTRKAGKKALEEMHRETQRMARSLQLAHEAKTKLKIPKQSLFEKFNFRTSYTGNNIKKEETPAREIALLQEAEKQVQGGVSTDADQGRGRAKSPPLDKGKGKARAITPPPSKKSLNLLPAKLKDPPPSRDDPDSDLEILDPALETQRRKAVEQKKKEQAILELKKRAGNAGLPKQKPKKKGHMTAKELQAELLRQSRQQAIGEREERIQELQARGVVIQTAEERAQDEAIVEDLIEKARLEAERVKKLEQKEKKQERLRKIAAGEKVSDVEDDGDDEDEVEDGGDWLEEEQGSFHELSDSEVEPLTESMDTDDKQDEVTEGFSDEDEAYEDEEEDEEMKEYRAAIARENSSPTPTLRISDMPRPYIDDEAEDEEDEGNEGDIDVPNVSTKKSRHACRTRITDEEDDDDDMELDNNTLEAPVDKNSFNNNPLAGFGSLKEAPLGLTQMFEGTMAPSMPEATSGNGLDALRNAPLSILHSSQGPAEFRTNQDQIPESQFGSRRIDVDLHFSQSQISRLSQPQSPSQQIKHSQENDIFKHHLQDHNGYDQQESFSQIPDPTPDTGFVQYSPAPQRFADTASPMSVKYGTQATQIISSRKKGRLKRAGDIEGDSSFETEPTIKDSPATVSNAFTIMKKAAKDKAAKDAFVKSKSEAKEMVDEAAVESDDEYAGLGGRSDDEENIDLEEAAKELAELINDQNDEKVNEQHIAAYYAEKERREDEKNVTKLFKDLHNGGLRRKRGAGFDLSDSEDEEERRRARKRANEARLRKLILEDENMAKVVNNPKRDAFLRSVEDRDKDDSMMFLDQVEDDLYLEFSQNPNSGESQVLEGMNDENVENEGDNNEDVEDPFVVPDDPLPSGHHQNNANSKESRDPKGGIARQTKPETLTSIRNTLSFLIEEESMEISHNITISDSSDDSDTEITITSRRKRITATSTTKSQVIDRVALKRQGSSNAGSALADGQTKLAFAPGGLETDVAFRVPSLLRRATANTGSFASNSDSQGSTSSSVSASEAVVKKAGAANSRSVAINYRGGAREANSNRREMERNRELEKRKRLMKMKEKRNCEAGKIMGLLKGKMSGFE